MLLKNNINIDMNTLQLENIEAPKVRLSKEYIIKRNTKDGQESVRNYDLNMYGKKIFVATDNIPSKSLFVKYNINKKNIHCDYVSITEENSDIIKHIDSIRKNIYERLVLFTNLLEYKKLNNNEIKLKIFVKDNVIPNVLNYKGKNIDINEKYLHHILKGCNIRMLLNIKSIYIKNETIRFNIFISKIYVDDLSNIEDTDIISYIINQYHGYNINNIDNLQKLEKLNVRKEYKKKQDIKNELLKIIENNKNNRKIENK